MKRIPGLLCGALLVGAPFSVWAHGSGYIFARVVPGTGCIELSLDFASGESPTISNREQAEYALLSDIRIRTPLGERKLTELEVEWSETSELSDSAPVPEPPVPEENPHRYLVASMDEVVAPGEQFRLALVKGSREAVVFWVDTGTSEESNQWQILISGDVSMPVMVPDKENGHLPLYGITSGAILLGGTILVFLSRSRRFAPLGIDQVTE